MDPIHPHVDVVPLGEIVPHELLALGLPLLGQARYRRGREPRLGAEELLQRAGTKSPLESPWRYNSGRTSVTFGERRMYGGRITLLNLWRLPSSSTLRSLTLGARTSMAPAPKRTSRSLA
jgi:hypothetical protein